MICLRLSSSGSGAASSIADRINRLSVGSSEEKTTRFAFCLFFVAASLTSTFSRSSVPAYRASAPTQMTSLYGDDNFPKLSGSR